MIFACLPKITKQLQLIISLRIFLKKNHISVEYNQIYAKFTTILLKFGNSHFFCIFLALQFLLKKCKKNENYQISTKLSQILRIFNYTQQKYDFFSKKFSKKQLIVIIQQFLVDMRKSFQFLRGLSINCNQFQNSCNYKCIQNCNFHLYTLGTQQQQSYKNSKIYNDISNSEQDIKQKQLLIQQILNLENKEIPSCSEIAQMDNQEFVNRVQFWKSEMKSQIKDLLNDLKALNKPIEFVEQQISFFEQLGFKNAKSMIARRPKLILHQNDEIQQRIINFCKILKADQQEIFNQLEKYPTALLASGQNAAGVVQELEKININHEELFSILSMHPSIFRGQIGRIRGFCELCRQYNLDAKKILLNHPDILRTKPQEFLVTMKHLKNRGLNDQAFEGMFLKNHYMLRWKLEVFDKKWDYLNALGVNNEQICQIVCQDPKFFSTSLQKIKSHVENLQYLGLNYEKIAQIFVKYHNLLKISSDTVKQNINWFEKMGFQRLIVAQMAQKCPRMLTPADTQQKNWDILLQKFEFDNNESLKEFIIEFPNVLTADLSKPHQFQKLQYIKNILDIPLIQAFQNENQLLLYGLEDCIGPRSHLLMNSDKKEIDFSDFAQYVSLSDEEFVEKYGKQFADIEQYQKYVQEWQQQQFPDIQKRLQEN
eukprot:TRINITY_DN10324_c0_g2_i7.p1 TRINITY_DN10324_c0_g2~~TRINITY_DN10324_c0_g2_i7.p1  ORF type:complete len:654 (-),score=43.44 TRINITY_DN10324_c0_g2_i7:180-2141(-)